MQYSVTTAPTVEWISEQDARVWMREAEGAEASLVLDLITEVRRGLEEELGRSFLSQTVTLWLDDKDLVDPLWLPLPPAIAITSVTEYDEDDAASVVSSSNYRISGLDPGRLVQVGDGFDVGRTTDGLKVIYTAGYGTSSLSIPSPLILEMKRRLVEQYVHRGWAEESKMQPFMTMGDLLASYRYDEYLMA